MIVYFHCNAAFVLYYRFRVVSLFLYIFDNLEHVLFCQQRRHSDSALSVADVVWNCVGHSLAHFQSRAQIFRQIIVNLCCIENIENRYVNRVILMVLRCRRFYML